MPFSVNASAARRFIRVVACVLYCGTSGMEGQETNSIEKLEITIIQGGNLVNHVKRRVASEPIVEVSDQNHSPVAGAIVTFT